MNSDLLKFAVFGIPAVIVLVWWNWRGVVSKRFYKSSWANIVGYATWLVMGLSLNRYGQTRFISSLYDSIVGLLITLPLIAIAYSLVLLLFSRRPDQGERWKFVSANVLMLVLWGSSLIAPN